MSPGEEIVQINPNGTIFIGVILVVYLDLDGFMCYVAQRKSDKLKFHGIITTKTT